MKNKSEKEIKIIIINYKYAQNCIKKYRKNIPNHMNNIVKIINIIIIRKNFCFKFETFNPKFFFTYNSQWWISRFNCSLFELQSGWKEFFFFHTTKQRARKKMKKKKVFKGGK